MITTQQTTIDSKLRRFATHIQYSALALVVLSIGASCAVAQNAHSPMPAMPMNEMSREQQANAGALLKIVRESTERFKDVKAAIAAGYALQFGCVSGSD